MLIERYAFDPLYGEGYDIACNASSAITMHSLSPMQLEQFMKKLAEGIVCTVFSHMYNLILSADSDFVWS